MPEGHQEKAKQKLTAGSSAVDTVCRGPAAGREQPARSGAMSEWPRGMDGSEVRFRRQCHTP